MKRLVIISCCILAFCGQLHSQVQARIAGLEDNGEYMGLLEKEAVLRVELDSLGAAISAVREKFRADPAGRAKYSAEILKLEGELFDVRSQAGIVAGRISAIEQEYVIRNLGSVADSAAVQTAGPAPSRQSADLVSNDFFRLRLPEKDYSALVEAQRRETAAANYVRIYLANYKTLATLAQQYAATDNAIAADSLSTRFGELSARNSLIADSVASLWEFISDNKLYCYNYLLDRLNKKEILASMERRTAIMREAAASVGGLYESDRLAAYYFGKKLVFEYELALAETGGLTKAMDSLGVAKSRFEAINLLLPKVILEERLFLDFSEIRIFSPARYDAANPIPEVAVHPKGTIYRIFVGSFSAKQPVSVFRGAYPVAYLRTPDGRWNYFLGGFATYEEAGKAVEEMKKAGFRTPRAAMWRDGVYYPPDEVAKSAPTAAGRLFQIEISGAGEEMPAGLRSAITGAAPGKDISRVGGAFILGPFSSEEEASKAAKAIKDSNPPLTVKISPLAL